MERPQTSKMSFLTHTFCDCGEGHVGGGRVGQIAERGVPAAELREIAEKHPEFCRFVDMTYQGHEAGVLVIDGGVDRLIGEGGKERLLAESTAQPFDTTFFNTRKKVVQNKHGRRNNCYADFQQDGDIPHGKPTVVAFDGAPEMKTLRGALPAFFGEWAGGLVAETNLYTNVSLAKVGIGFHGDSERRKVIGVRLGAASTPLRFQWYHRSVPATDEIAIELRDGDMYVMSDKAVGFDWMKSSIPTLRHGTGRKAVRREVGKKRGRAE